MMCGQRRQLGETYLTTCRSLSSTDGSGLQEEIYAPADHCDDIVRRPADHKKDTELKGLQSMDLIASTNQKMVRCL